MLPTKCRSGARISLTLSAPAPRPGSAHTERRPARKCAPESERQIPDGWTRSSVPEPVLVLNTCRMRVSVHPARSWIGFRSVGRRRLRGRCAGAACRGLGDAVGAASGASSADCGSEQAPWVGCEHDERSESYVEPHDVAPRSPEVVHATMSTVSGGVHAGSRRQIRQSRPSGSTNHTNDIGPSA